MTNSTLVALSRRFCVRFSVQPPREISLNERMLQRDAASFLLAGVDDQSRLLLGEIKPYDLIERRSVLGAEIREALQHAIKVNKEGSCQWPRARVIPVRDVYPSPSTTYIPHCAILHRCSDDTGCCRSEALTCVPKHSHRVELSFYVSTFLFERPRLILSPPSSARKIATVKRSIDRFLLTDNDSRFTSELSSRNERDYLLPTKSQSAQSSTNSTRAVPACAL